MAKGYLYKMNNTTWSKSQSKKMNATTVSDGKVRHADATTWYDNYPMEQYYEKYFNATWTQGYFGSGGALYNGTFWEHDLVVGDPDNFRSLVGFNKTDIQNFIGSGTVTDLQIHLNLKQTSTNGSPRVWLGKHIFTSEPATYNGWTNTEWGDQVLKTFPNKAYGGYWVVLNPSQARFNGNAIAGIALWAYSATATDMARFNGTTTFNTQLWIKVLK